MGGRITLINSVLAALPIYLLSFFKIPKKVVHKIVSIQRKFLWGGQQDFLGEVGYSLPPQEQRGPRDQRFTHL